MQLQGLPQHHDTLQGLNIYEQTVQAQGMLDMAMANDNGIDNTEPRIPQSTTPTSFRHCAMMC